MSSDVNTNANTDLTTPPKVFKFHNISKDRILGGKKMKRDVSKHKLQLQVRANSLEDSPEKDETHLILQKYIPIKQKFEGINTSFVETKTCSVNITNLQPRKYKGPEDTGNEKEQQRGGLRLKNISSLLQEPRRSIYNHDVVNLNNSDNQEAPLDLSKRGNQDILPGPGNPLDLSIKPKQDVKIAPKPQSLSNNHIHTNAINGSNINQSSYPAQNSVQPLKFVMIDNKFIFKPLHPQQPSCTISKEENPLSSLVANRSQSNYIGQQISPSTSTASKIAVQVQSPSIASPSQESQSQEPIQMLFLNGHLARVLPRLDCQSDILNRKDEKNDKTKNLSDGNNTISKDCKKHMKKSENMIKTNETITKNGDLFCTFKNIKQIRLNREQQSRRSRQKKKR